MIAVTIEGLTWVTDFGGNDRLRRIANETIVKVTPLLPPGMKVPLVVVSNQRTKYRLGTYWASKNTMNLYAHHLSRYSDLAVADVVRHELAHAAKWFTNPYGTSHDADWRRWAIRLGAYPRANSNEDVREQYAATLDSER